MKISFVRWLKEAFVTTFILFALLCIFSSFMVNPSSQQDAALTLDNSPWPPHPGQSQNISQLKLKTDISLIVLTGAVLFFAPMDLMGGSLAELVMLLFTIVLSLSLLLVKQRGRRIVGWLSWFVLWGFLIRLSPSYEWVQFYSVL